MTNFIAGALGIRSYIFIAVIAAIVVVVGFLNLAVPETSSLYMSSYVVSLFGKYLCYAILALAIDLVWGFCGVLSLGHGAFFALGGYAMGMYLMRQIGTRGVYGHPELPDFMVFLNWQELPWYWYGFDMFWFRGPDGGPGPGGACLRVRLVRVPLACHGGLSLDHHPGDDLRAAARVSSATTWASAATTA